MADFPDNGILARVPGESIAAGSQQLPTPGPDQPLTLSTVVPDVRDLGAVRITYELATHRHGKSRRWYWLAVRADLEPA